MPTGNFDIDFICELNLSKRRITQKHLKHSVGNRLKQHGHLRKILGEKRRCWQLTYTGRFHMDVLPAIPDDNRSDDSILITDRKLTRWQYSNPIGYADWFVARMEIMDRTLLEKSRAAVATRLQGDIEDVPAWRVRTPLQRTVQLLKRHRDLFFPEDDDKKPASIVITTLAARAYTGETDLEVALRNVAGKMSGQIDYRDGKW